MTHDARSPRFSAFRGRFDGFVLPLLLCAVLVHAGCGGQDTGSSGAGMPSLDTSGLQLPPDFQPVDLPVERRQEIFREAHLVRARAVQEANRKLPMDESHLPIGDTAAFDQRVAEHKAIIDAILEENLAELAERYGITSDDLAKIEDEAGRLRWLPPEDPDPADLPPPESEPLTAPAGESPQP